MAKPGKKSSKKRKALRNDSATGEQLPDDNCHLSGADPPRSKQISMAAPSGSRRDSHRTSDNVATGSSPLPELTLSVNDGQSGRRVLPTGSTSVISVGSRTPEVRTDTASCSSRTSTRDRADKSQKDLHPTVEDVTDEEDIPPRKCKTRSAQPMNSQRVNERPPLSSNQEDMASSSPYPEVVRKLASDSEMASLTTEAIAAADQAEQAVLDSEHRTTTAKKPKKPREERRRRAPSVASNRYRLEALKRDGTSNIRDQGIAWNSEGQPYEVGPVPSWGSSVRMHGEDIVERVTKLRSARGTPGGRVNAPR
ncbi:hypothetical protein FB451DRAFT_1193834 [Mycena latifolia]|nr:hypothetical protein FB451DRAFT_1193834 [Mycena latifolia]